MRVKNPDRSRLIAAAMGKIPCDLTVENVKFVNVITGQIYPASVDVLDGIVVRVRDEGKCAQIESAVVYDGGGRYLAPGCIDIHMHVESTMLTPENFGKAAILCGTTSVFVDPHEIGNVLGIDGVKFMIDNAKGSPVRQFNLAPSCLPSVPGAEGTGAEFEAEQIAELLEMDGVYGIAEVMDFYNVIHDSKKMHDIVAEGLKRDVLIQGHAPGLNNYEIAAYALAGPTDNHSLRTAWELVENLHAGLYVDMQSSSLGYNFIPEMMKGLEGMRYTDHITLCNDDVHAKDLIETGHVNRLIKAALRGGGHPMDVMRWCTYNAARSAKVDDLGAIAPGYVADMQLLDELDGRDPYAVFFEGKLVAEAGKLVDAKENLAIPENVLGGTVRADGLNSADDLRLKAPEGCGDTVKVTVVDFAPARGHIETCVEELPVKDGYVDITGRDNLSYIAVWNRHGAGDHTIAVVKNQKMTNGAMATTVSHDCHNLTVGYTNAEDGYLACKALIDCGGGFAVAQNGEILGVLELPVAGLMSTLPCLELVPAIAKQEEATDRVFRDHGRMMTYSIVALACVPWVLITDRGIFDGRTQQFYNVFPEN